MVLILVLMCASVFLFQNSAIGFYTNDYFTKQLSDGFYEMVDLDGYLEWTKKE